MLNFINRGRDSGIFRQIPLNSAGKLFVSPMPSGAYDPGSLLKLYRHHHVDHVFSLVTDSEIQNKARKDLFKEYTKLGITYSRYIIPDFQAPSLDVIKNLVLEAKQRLQKRERIIVHCHAGVGRTSLAVACIIIAINRLTAEEAVKHIKSEMMVNITSEQRSLIDRFYEYNSSLETELRS